MKRCGLALVLVLSASSAFGQELIRNGTFDRDLSDWFGSRPWSRYGVGEPTWVPGDDSQGNAQSGSASTGWFCNDVHPWCFQLWLNQCVPVRPGGTYQLSAFERGSGEVSAGWFSSSDCSTGDLGAAARAALKSDTWAPWATPVAAPSDAHSMLLRLMGRVEETVLSARGTVRWDNVSLQVLSEPAAVSKSLLVPTAANTESPFGAVFRTRLTLLSLGSTRKASVRLQVLPRGFEPGPSRTIDLLPGQVTTLDDTLGDLGFEGGAAILVTHAEDQPLYATAEVYADSADGRYTTPVPVLGSSSNESRVATPGISNSPGSRTNVGCSNIGEIGQEVYAEVHAADGSKLGTLNLSLPRLSWTQEPVPFPVSRGYVVWGNGYGMSGPPIGVSCFAVVVDNATNDGSLLR